MVTRARLLRYIGPAFGIAVFIIAISVLWRELRGERLRDIVRHMDAIPPSQLLAAVALTALSFLVLTGYDLVSVRYVRTDLSYRRVALASFLNYAFSQGLGFPLLTGGSVRFRMYSGWGLSGLRITSLIAFASLSFWLGVLLVGGIIFTQASPAIAAVLGLPPYAVRPIGIGALVVVGAYVFWTMVGRRIFRVGEWRLRRPSSRLAAQQLIVALCDWALASSVLYVLLPAEIPVSYAAFVGIFLLAFVAGIISNVPAGLGVFETVMVLLLPEPVSQSALFGALLAYRGIYYLLPLAVAATLLGGYELLRRIEVVRASSAAWRWEPLLAPNLIALSTFAAGAILLASVATPLSPPRVAALTRLVPMTLVELAHLGAALAGIGLILLANGVQRHLAPAFRWSLGLIIAGSLLALLKGLDYEEAIALAVVLGIVLPARRHFYREARVLDEPYSPGWIAAILLALSVLVWLGTFSFKHVPYSPDLWLATGPAADSSRFLRATTGVVVVASIVALSRLIRPRAEPAPLPRSAELARAHRIIAGSSDAMANVALLGDKELLFSEQGDAFLMYAVHRRSWVALGDPVGPGERWTELAWRFRRLAERAGGWTAFYLVGRHDLPLYVDLGLTLLKVGEEARIPIEHFTGGRARAAASLDAAARSHGATFEILNGDDVEPLLPELREVDARWRAGFGALEKSFAEGSLVASYVSSLPLAVVRVEGRIVAFACVWLGGDRGELSLDVVRTDPAAAVPGLFEFLVVESMLYGQSEGYRWFVFATVPAEGLDHGVLAPLWSRVGSLPFRLGEHFADARSLRDFAAPFAPVWEPRYLAAPAGLALPRTLADVTALIAGGSGERDRG
ncbi:MAG TPA: bifunctional lysylphosphatidylglycerol flippase/synthetase MprF [Gemmatimonadaceae bacterium]|nr:bifunctional lysylphosphatidylglycerol flippase/synthetase MprF [Gemmatimonadaceae bacterium]